MGEPTIRRSEVNAIIRLMEHFIGQQKLDVLKAIREMTPKQWLKVALSREGGDYERIARLSLGYDVTTFGTGNFWGTRKGVPHMGLALVTDLNGEVRPEDDARGPDPVTYAFKYLFTGEGQVTPPHYHPYKTETIGVHDGELVTRVWAAHPSDYKRIGTNGQVNVDVPGKLSDRPFVVAINELPVECRAGTRRTLESGDRVTLYGIPPEGSGVDGPLYHEFWGGRKGAFSVLWERSRPNRDVGDNRFLTPLDRFDVIKEDEGIYRILCNELHNLFLGTAQDIRGLSVLISEAQSPTEKELDTRLIRAGALDRQRRITPDCYAALGNYFRKGGR